jgi:hypothetical protein
VLGHERDHLPAGLQDRHVGIEVDPVQALDIQPHVPAQDLVHRHHACAHDTLRNHTYARRMNQDELSDQPKPAQPVGFGRHRGRHALGQQLGPPRADHLSV